MKRGAPLKRTSRLSPGTKQKVIRQLKPGEALPPGPPKRYGTAQGYIRLRWRIAPLSYVETYEHRVDGDHVTTAEHVHHQNEVRDDNDPGNLKPLTATEHAAEHSALELERGRKMAALYRDGVSIPKLARQFGVNASTVYRRITAEGVDMRTKADYAAVVDAEEVADLYRSGRSIHSLARQYRIETIRLTALIRSTGTPIRKPGRPRANSASAENAARLTVRARSGGICEVCGAARATNWHHRKNASQGGKWAASNGLDVCGSGTTGCHGHITTHPQASREQGWAVPSHREPSGVPVWLAGRGWVFLDDLGNYENEEAA